MLILNSIKTVSKHTIIIFITGTIGGTLLYILHPVFFDKLLSQQETGTFTFI